MFKKVLVLSFFLISLCLFSQKKSIENLSAFPNPFSTSTTIQFDSNQEQGVYLIVKNVIGKTVFKKAYYTDKGTRKITFDRKNLKSGIYIYTIQSNQNMISKRFVIK